MGVELCLYKVKVFSYFAMFFAKMESASGFMNPDQIKIKTSFEIQT